MGIAIAYKIDFCGIYFKYVLFSFSCAVDDTVKFEQAPSVQVQRFSFEAFKFIGENPFVFFHCRERICNARDPNSRCAQGCVKGRRRRRDVSNGGTEHVYRLAQGPFVLAEGEDLERSEKLPIPRMREFPGQMSLYSALVPCLSLHTLFSWHLK